MKTISIFGATGTLGAAALDVVRLHPDKFRIDTLTAGGNCQGLEKICAGIEYKTALSLQNNGEDAIVDAAGRKVDLVVMAIAGMAALKPTLAAIRAGCTIAFASKEALVAAGDLMMEEAAKHGATLLPLDSEHNAIFQCLNGKSVDRIVLTASGGPFLHKKRSDLTEITPEQAVAHPKWTMGAKISVDSATMMNKGLEVIEARYLFNLPSSQIDVLVHPQSLVHGMVEYADGSFLCQMGPPDMRTAMTNCLFWPERGQTPGDRLKLSDLQKLEFFEPDEVQFPALKLARQALKTGQAACIALNAANEIAVAAFLNREIGFLDITDVAERALDHDHPAIASLEDVFAYDQYVRETVTLRS